MIDAPPDGDRPDPTDAHWAALARYLDGHATPDQRAYVEGWAASDAHRGEFTAVRALWQLAGVLPPPARVDSLWRGLAARMHRPATDVTTRPAAADPPAARS